MFMENGDNTAFWYLQLICYLTSLQFTIGQNEFVEFLVFSGTMPNLGNLSVQHHLLSIQPCLKSTYHLLTIISDGAESE